MITKPLLSPADCPLKNPNFFKGLQFPYLVSPKFDGIRGITQSGMALSRTMKMLPSYQIQDEFTGIMGLDGEFIEGNERDFEVYNRTQSHVMSEDKPGDIRYFVFDTILPEHINRPFYERLEVAHRLVRNKDGYVPVEHDEVNNLEELLEVEDKNLKLGFEGVMLRNPLGRYKQNRATYNDNIIYKLKRFQDTEALIIGLEERMTNTNALEKDERGYAKRSSAKAGLVGAQTVGKFIVNWQGHELPVAPGAFKHHELKWMWNNQEQVIGQFLKFRFFAHGVKDSPRFPRAVGFRSSIDMI